MPKRVVVTGAFDDLRSRHLRLLQEAARFGEVTVLLWSDQLVQAQAGAPPKFPLAERRYFLEAVRYVTRVVPVASRPGLELPPELAGLAPDVWVEGPDSFSEANRTFCHQHGADYVVLSPEQLRGFPEPTASDRSQVGAKPEAAGVELDLRPAEIGPRGGSPRKKVVVTGCYDWLHSGHVRFFEEVSAYGDLYVIVGHDENIRLLKGPGHPLLRQQERRYVAGSIRYVTEALISSGTGWLDAEPEIQRLKADIYAVNEDGDRGGKRDYCARHGLEYLVLKRIPAPGLPSRSSTELRGF